MGRWAKPLFLPIGVGGLAAGIAAVVARQGR